MTIYVASGGLGSFAGLAELLRSGRPISIRAIGSAMLNSGLISLAVGLSWYKFFLGDGNIHFMVVVSILAGIGGADIVNIVALLSKKLVTLTFGRFIELDPAKKEGPGDGNANK